MKVKINKEGKEKNYNLIKSWNDVTLDKWVKLISRREKTKTQDALDTISVLSDIPKKLINELAIGDYADIETYLKNGLEDNLTKLIAVLYRPITERDGKDYSIEAYGVSDSRMRAKKFEKMKARDVNSSLVFFWTLGKELSIILPLYLMVQSQAILDKMQESNLQTSGVGLV